MTLLNQLKAITDERADNYAHPLTNFLKIALMWSVEYESVFTPIDVIAFMSLVKIVRENNTHKDDNKLDLVGYAVTCYEKIDEAMIKLGYTGIEYFRTVKALGNGYCMGFMYELLGEYKTFEAEQKRPSTRLLQ